MFIIDSTHFYKNNIKFAYFPLVIIHLYEVPSFLDVFFRNQERWFVRKIDFEAQIYPEGFVPYAFVQNENPLYSYE